MERHRRRARRLWLGTLLLAALCFVLMLASPAHAQQEQRQPRQKTESPYFFVKSDDPSVDRLPLKGTAVDVKIAGVIADIRRSGRVHPAWNWGMGAMVAAFVLTEVITYSPVGRSLYLAVTKGSPGASIAPLSFAPPPPPLVTGGK